MSTTTIETPKYLRQPEPGFYWRCIDPSNPHLLVSWKEAPVESAPLPLPPGSAGSEATAPSEEDYKFADDIITGFFPDAKPPAAETAKIRVAHFIRVHRESAVAAAIKKSTQLLRIQEENLRFFANSSQEQGQKLAKSEAQLAASEATCTRLREAAEMVARHWLSEPAGDWSVRMDDLIQELTALLPAPPVVPGSLAGGTPSRVTPSGAAPTEEDIKCAKAVLFCESPLREDRLAWVAKLIAARVAAAQAELEVAQRDAGVFAATLARSATQLECDTHTVEHAVAKLIADLATAIKERDEARAAHEQTTAIWARETDSLEASLTAARASLAEAREQVQSYGAANDNREQLKIALSAKQRECEELEVRYELQIQTIQTLNDIAADVRSKLTAEKQAHSEARETLEKLHVHLHNCGCHDSDGDGSTIDLPMRLLNLIRQRDLATQQLTAVAADLAASRALADRLANLIHTYQCLSVGVSGSYCMIPSHYAEEVLQAHRAARGNAPSP